MMMEPTNPPALSGALAMQPAWSWSGRWQVISFSPNTPPMSWVYCRICCFSPVPWCTSSCTTAMAKTTGEE